MGSLTGLAHGAGILTNHRAEGEVSRRDRVQPWFSCWWSRLQNNVYWQHPLSHDNLGSVSSLVPRMGP